MKTIETSLYSYTELSPASQERVISKLAECAEMDFTDLTSSLEALCDACLLRLVSCSYDECDRHHDVRIAGNNEDLSGPRALAWFLRILMRHGWERPARFAYMVFPGVYGLTGAYYDDDLAESVWQSLLRGDTVREAFSGLSYRLCKIVIDEMNYLRSAEYILETLDTDAEIYTEKGEEY